MRRMIQDYMVVSEYEIGLLNHKVKELLRNGYQPKGQVILFKSDEGVLYTQTLVKYKKSQDKTEDEAE